MKGVHFNGESVDRSFFLFPPEKLSDSPSRKDGIETDVEKIHRIWGCELIQEAGILLQLPQVVMVTGQNILHRFFFRLVQHPFFQRSI